METKDIAVRDGLYEEAQLLRRRQQDYKSELAGLPAEGSSLPVVRSCDIEAVVAAWSGVPVERMTEDETTKLIRLVSVCNCWWRRCGYAPGQTGSGVVVSCKLHVCGVSVFLWASAEGGMAVHSIGRHWIL
jgi:hypothetical protein